MASKFGTEIHRRLADNQPADYIAQRVGLRPRVIRWHRLGRCQCVVDGLEAQPQAILDRPVSTDPVVLSLERLQSLPWFAQVRYAFIAGLTEEYIADETGLDVKVIGELINDDVRAEAERRYTWALERVREMFPVRWLKHQAEARQRELVEAARTSVDPELMARFFTELVHRQRALLPVSEFPGFVQWLGELAEHRHPAMVPVIAASIKAEQKALENLVN